MQKETVLITGSSRGLGAQLALVFSRNNHNVILHGRQESRLIELRNTIVRNGVECQIVAGDLASQETILKLAKVGSERNVSILINNAGVSLTADDPEEDLKLPLNEISQNQIDTILNTNLVAAVKLTMEIYKTFLRLRHGTVININSLLGLETRELNSIYCASKWGLRGFTDSFRLEAEKNGVRVIGVYPTRIKTKKVFTEGMEPEFVAQKIYEGYVGTLTELVIDGRPKI